MVELNNFLVDINGDCNIIVSSVEAFVDSWFHAEDRAVSGSVE